MDYNNDVYISEMVGQVFTSVVEGSDSLIFTSASGKKYVFYHSQDCCEHVIIEDICGYLNDLVGYPLTMAEEADNDFPRPEYCSESYTWTFYKFATVKGYVTVRWLGSSNGYYSEKVSLICSD